MTWKCPKCGREFSRQTLPEESMMTDCFCDVSGAAGTKETQ